MGSLGRFMLLYATTLFQLCKTKHIPNGTSEYLPVVLWHGMGDSCCADYSIGAVKNHIQKLLPGVFVHSIATGTGPTSDIFSSFFGDVNEQVANACLELRSMPELEGGYVAVGFSQGGQFLRGVVQRCQHLGPRMHTLVTMGAQHQGVMNIPDCWMPSFNQTSSLYCNIMRRILETGAYNGWVQRHVVQAQYFKDPYLLDMYRQSSSFLALLNNEANDMSEAQRAQQRTNLADLQRLVLYQFEDDVTVVPRESSQFGFFDGEKLLTMEDTELYQEDILGLRALQEGGRLVRESAPGFHMQFKLRWFGEVVVKRYVAVKRGGGRNSDIWR